MFKKLMTLARGQARQSAQVLLDANALLVFEQEIVDVEQTISNRKKAMAEVIASRKQIEREIAAIQQLLNKRESQARTLIEENNTISSLVEELALEIADHESMLQSLVKQKDTLSAQIINIQGAIQKAAQSVCQYRRDLRMAKAQQLSSSGLARANNLPEQLADLESTRDQVNALNDINEDYEQAWHEVSQRMNTTNSLDDSMVKLEKNKKVEEVISRLRKS